MTQDAEEVKPPVDDQVREITDDEPEQKSPEYKTFITEELYPLKLNQVEFKKIEKKGDYFFCNLDDEGNVVPWESDERPPFITFVNAEVFPPAAVTLALWPVIGPDFCSWAWDGNKDNITLEPIAFEGYIYTYSVKDHHLHRNYKTLELIAAAGGIMGPVSLSLTGGTPPGVLTTVQIGALSTAQIAPLAVPAPDQKPDTGPVAAGIGPDDADYMQDPLDEDSLPNDGLPFD